MPTIDIHAESDTAFVVTITDSEGQTTHRVTVSSEFADRLVGQGGTAEELVRVSIEFLLRREAKESILREFDITVISRYFPEYEDELRDRFRA